MTWRTGPVHAPLDLRRPCVMGILNVTPDSFSDGGRHLDHARALEQAHALVHAGAQIIDIGGESTRPGSASVPAQEQVRRVVPVIRAMRSGPGPLARVRVSVDTTSADVAERAVDAGADIVNDVSAGCDDPSMLAAVSRLGVGLVLMHRPLPPRDDRYSTVWSAGQQPAPIAPTDDVVQHVLDHLRDRIRAALDAGIDPLAIALDPGLGFGKTVEQNLQLIERTGELLALGRPIVSGISRKSFTGLAGLGRASEPAERLASTVGLSVVHVLRGARVLRVHDPKPVLEAVNAAWACVHSTPLGRQPE